jgi:hypothetical protein
VTAVVVNYSITVTAFGVSCRITKNGVATGLSSGFGPRQDGLLAVLGTGPISGTGWLSVQENDVVDFTCQGSDSEARVDSPAQLILTPVAAVVSSN